MGVASKYNKVVGTFTAEIPKEIEFFKCRAIAEKYPIDTVFTVLKFFTSNSKYGKSATAIVTDGSSIFGINLPSHKTTEVSELLRDPEVFAQVNDFKLGIKLYSYLDDKEEIHYSTNLVDLD